MKKLRVAHVITRLCKGGAQENTFHTVRLADGERFDVDLISGLVPRHEASLEDDVWKAGIDIHRVKSLVRPPHPIFDWVALHALTKLFQERQYDIVHTHTSKAGIIGRWAAKRAKVPIVVHTPHGHVFHGYFPKPITWAFVQMERRTARFTDRIITLTDRGMTEHLAQRVGRASQYRTIFSGIDLSRYEDAMKKRWETRESLGVFDDTLLVGGVGRLEPIKGFRYFVAAAEQILEAGPKVKFVLAGVGRCEGELRAQAASLGGAFEFLGYRDDVPKLMAALDILVVPSVNEGMGRVLLEAGAAGTPAVASRVGGIPDVVDDGVSGRLVTPEVPSGLADAVLDLAKNPALRQSMGIAARKKVVPKYGLEGMVGQIESLYEELAEEKGLNHAIDSELDDEPIAYEA